MPLMNNKKPWELLKKRLPILKWLPIYSHQNFVNDLIAGLSVGLTLIPEAIAYGVLAGFTPQYGLYSAIMGCFVYVLFGGVKEISIGPTAILSLITHHYEKNAGVEYAILLCFMSGCITFMLGVIQLGFVVDFISVPVTVGFTAAAALTIATSQVKGLLGLNFEDVDEFVDIWKSIIYNIKDTALWDSVLGIACLSTLLLLKTLKSLEFKSEKVEMSIIKKIGVGAIWLIGTARNVIVFVFCGLFAYFFIQGDSAPFKLTGSVQTGLPSLALPPFSVMSGNETTNFIGMVQHLGASLFVIPAITLLEVIAISKAFSESLTIDATQEMMAVGLANICGSFVQSYPVTGAISRAAILKTSGAQTPLNGLYAGLLVLLALTFLTPYIQYIPKATLSAVIISAVIFLIDCKDLKQMWKTKKSDLMITALTFFSSIFLGLEFGILVGIGINILFLLYFAARPGITIEDNTDSLGVRYLLVTPEHYVVYPSVHHVCSEISKCAIDEGNGICPVIVDCKYIQFIDYTTAKGFKCLEMDFERRNQSLHFVHLASRVLNILEAFELKGIEGDAEKNIECVLKGSL